MPFSLLSRLCRGRCGGFGGRLWAARRGRARRYSGCKSSLFPAPALSSGDCEGWSYWKPPGVPAAARGAAGSARAGRGVRDGSPGPGLSGRLGQRGSGQPRSGEARGPCPTSAPRRAGPGPVRGDPRPPPGGARRQRPRRARGAGWARGRARFSTGGRTADTAAPGAHPRAASLAAPGHGGEGEVSRAGPAPHPAAPSPRGTSDASGDE